MASSRFLRSQFRVSGFVSDGRVNGAWVVEWKVVETGPKSPKKRLFIAIFWSIPTLASSFSPSGALGKCRGLGNVPLALPRKNPTGTGPEPFSGTSLFGFSEAVRTSSLCVRPNP